MKNRAAQLLSSLQFYLISKGIYVPKMSLRHSKVLDEANKRSARSFCHIQCGSSVIHHAAALNRLPDTAIVGILLHEIGHAVLGCDIQPDDEVAVDEWIVKHVPQAKYEYSMVTYTSSSGRKRVADNLETVSDSFVQQVWRY